MQLVTILLLSLFTVSSTAKPSIPQDPKRNILGLDQIPFENVLPPLARTRTITHTHFEINVVSTVYRTGSQIFPTAVSPPDAANTQSIESFVELGEETCDTKACGVCRMVNDCYEDNAACANCDLAPYCRNCPSEVTWPLFDDLDIEA